MIRAEKHCLLDSKSHLEEVLGWTGSGLVSLHMKGTLPGESFAILEVASPRRGLSLQSISPDAGASGIETIRKCNIKQLVCEECRLILKYRGYDS